MRRRVSKLFIAVALVAVAAMLYPALGKKKGPKKIAPEIGKEYHPEGTKGGPMVSVPAGKFMPIS